MKRFAQASLVLASLSAWAAAGHAAELVIATVNNPHMIEMQKLTPEFEKANPGITLKWVTLDETTLRQRVTTDIATQGGQFDVMTIGLYEAPIWSKKGWLKPIATDAAYDVDDLLPAIRSGLTNEGKLYAAPFYGPGLKCASSPTRSAPRSLACTACACAASRAGATTWPSSPRW
jgi:sorbitol/mannitol transport system substrate-binding protein